MHILKPLLLSLIIVLVTKSLPAQMDILERIRIFLAKPLKVFWGAIEANSVKNTGKASGFKTLGDDEKRKFYLFPDKNVVRLNNYLIYLSETEKGDKVLLSSFDLTK